MLNMRKKYLQSLLHYVKVVQFKKQIKFLANQNDVLTQIRAVGESYPELFSSKQFENLQREIAEEK